MKIDLRNPGTSRVIDYVVYWMGSLSILALAIAFWFVT